MPAIDTRVIAQEMGEHLNLLVSRSVDHRALETLAVGMSSPNSSRIFLFTYIFLLTACTSVLTIVFGVGGYMYYAIRIQSK